MSVSVVPVTDLEDKDVKVTFAANSSCASGYSAVLKRSSMFSSDSKESRVCVSTKSVSGSRDRSLFVFSPDFGLRFETNNLGMFTSKTNNTGQVQEDYENCSSDMAIRLKTDAAIGGYKGMFCLEPQAGQLPISGYKHQEYVNDKAVSKQKDIAWHLASAEALKRSV